MKKAKQKEQPPAGEMSEHETDPENDEDEGENMKVMKLRKPHHLQVHLLPKRKK